ncbi:MAG: FkbM family methyltransferase [Bacteroidota bacterium]
MRKIVSDFLKKHILKRGYIIANSEGFVVENKTTKEEVESFIKKLYPYKIDKELIRLGPNSDGGYLVPDDLVDIAACFSPGVDQISGFEEDCSRLGMKLFLADKSVDEPNLSLGINEFNFIKKYIGCSINDDYITMEKWVNDSNLDKNSDLLLQMDIEGYEYFVLLNMSNELLSRFRVVVIEFHSLHKIWNNEFYKLISTVFEKILQTHTCIHIHPNNCSGIDIQNGIEIPRLAEFTFIRNDRINTKKPEAKFPHSLDFDNTPKEHIVLPKNWYSSNTH